MKREELIEQCDNKAQLIEAGFTEYEADGIIEVRKEIARLVLSLRSDESLKGDATEQERKEEKAISAVMLRLGYLELFRKNGCDSRKAMDTLFASMYGGALNQFNEVKP